MREAMKNLETSIEKSISNDHQKGLSYLKIGERGFQCAWLCFGATQLWQRSDIHRRKKVWRDADVTKRKTILDIGEAVAHHLCSGQFAELALMTRRTRQVHWRHARPVSKQNETSWVIASFVEQEWRANTANHKQHYRLVFYNTRYEINRLQRLQKVGEADKWR